MYCWYVMTHKTYTSKGKQWKNQLPLTKAKYIWHKWTSITIKNNKN